MKILIIHRYFWPDSPPYAQMLRHMAGKLAADGHEVTVLSTQPSYNPAYPPPRQPYRESMDGFDVRRVWLFRENHRNLLARGLNAVLFSLRVACQVAIRRYDVIMAATAPPVLIAGVAARLASVKRARFIYHCQDIHPESGVLGGMLTNRFVIGALRKLDIGTCALASRIVVLSGDMADTLRERGLTDTAKLRVINNFMLDADLSSPGQDMPISGAEQPKLRIIFAGNIGRFQGLESIIDAMHLLQDEERVELLLVGGGVAKASLQIRAGDLLKRSVRFLEHKSQSAVERLIADSDVGLIALQAGVYRYAYPSKTATYMKLGCPLLVCMDKASELSEMVEREGLGEVCEPGDPVAIAAAIHKLRERKADLARRRARIIELGREMFGRDQALDKWSRLVKELAAAAHP